jgi:hypothetical protein
MDGFDPISMTYMATNFDNTETATSDYTNMMMMPPADYLEQYSNHEYYSIPPPQATPSLNHFSTYDDAFSDAAGVFDTMAETGTVDPQEVQDAKEIAIEQGHMFLKFLPPQHDHVLLDHTLRQTSAGLNADLLGLFFTDKSAWTRRTEDAQLMCYRRNIFQVSGTVVLSRAFSHIVLDQTKQIPILSQELVISATESAEGSPTKIICVPWKTPPNGNPTAEDRAAEKEPTAISLNLSNAQEGGDGNLATLPFHWKRLQFRNATANNGRRKELQQHFILHLKVVATLATGGKVTICHAKSNPIVVRGRSPRNFQSRKDILLTGNGTQAKKANSVRPRMPSQADQGHARKLSRSSVVNVPRQEVPVATPFDPAAFQMPALFNNNAFQHGAMTAIPPVARVYTPKDYAISSPGHLVRQSSGLDMPAPASIPQKLSLIDDDDDDDNDEDEPKQACTNPPKDGNPDTHAPVMPARIPSSFALQVGGRSPDDCADLLYEYFPLTLDDWQPPVDAVYRPHVVHHINPLPENKSRDRLSRLKNKRYFSEGVG